MNLDTLAIRAILEKAEHFPWSLQGMGMFRLYLSREVRLHVWDARFVVPRVSTIHTHPWDFVSRIISGCLTNRLYEQSYPPSGTHWRQRIVCGPAATAGADMTEGEKKVEVALTLTSMTSYLTGASYSQAADQIHETLPSSGTVTVITRAFRKDTEHADVFFRLDKEWVSAEPRDATQAEILAMKEVALDKWEA